MADTKTTATEVNAYREALLKRLKNKLYLIPGLFNDDPQQFFKSVAQLLPSIPQPISMSVNPSIYNSLLALKKELVARFFSFERDRENFKKKWRDRIATEKIAIESIPGLREAKPDVFLKFMQSRFPELVTTDLLAAPLLLRGMLWLKTAWVEEADFYSVRNQGKRALTDELLTRYMNLWGELKHSRQEMLAQLTKEQSGWLTRLLREKLLSDPTIKLYAIPGLFEQGDRPTAMFIQFMRTIVPQIPVAVLSVSRNDYAQMELWTLKKELAEELKTRYRVDLLKRLEGFRIVPWQIPGVMESDPKQYENFLRKLFPRDYQQFVVLYPDLVKERADQVQTYEAKFQRSRQRVRLVNLHMLFDDCKGAWETLNFITTRNMQMRDLRGLVGESGGVDVYQNIAEIFASRLRVMQKDIWKYIDKFVRSHNPVAHEALREFVDLMRVLPKPLQQKILLQWFAIEQHIKQFPAFVGLLQRIGISLEALLEGKKQEFTDFFARLAAYMQARDSSSVPPLTDSDLSAAEKLKSYYSDLGVDLKDQKLSPGEQIIAFEVERQRVLSQVERVAVEQKKIQQEMLQQIQAVEQKIIVEVINDQKLADADKIKKIITYLGEIGAVQAQYAEYQARIQDVPIAKLTLRSTILRDAVIANAEQNPGIMAIFIALMREVDNVEQHSVRFRLDQLHVTPAVFFCFAILF